MYGCDRSVINDDLYTYTRVREYLLIYTYSIRFEILQLGAWKNRPFFLVSNAH